MTVEKGKPTVEHLRMPGLFPLSGKNATDGINRFLTAMSNTDLSFFNPNIADRMVMELYTPINQMQLANPYIDDTPFQPGLGYYYGFGSFVLASYLQAQEYVSQGKMAASSFGFPAITNANFDRLAALDTGKSYDHVRSRIRAPEDILTYDSAEILVSTHFEYYGAGRILGGEKRRRAFKAEELGFLEAVRKKDFAFSLVSGAADAKALLQMADKDLLATAPLTPQP